MTNQFISQQQLEAHSEWLDSGGTAGKRLVLQDADLQCANLQCADLQDADLQGTNLQGAILQGAILQGANLQGADLRYADLRYAELQEANLQDVDLQGANLQGASLQDANLQGAAGLAIVEDSAERLKAVARQVLANPESLEMHHWHNKCGTAHCLAGWAIHQAGALGSLLEESEGPQVAGLKLLGVEAYSHFFDESDEVIAWLSSLDLGDAKTSGYSPHSLPDEGWEWEGAIAGANGYNGHAFVANVASDPALQLWVFSRTGRYRIDPEEFARKKISDRSLAGLPVELDPLEPATRERESEED